MNEDEIREQITIWFSKCETIDQICKLTAIVEDAAQTDRDNRIYEIKHLD